MPNANLRSVLLLAWIPVAVPVAIVVAIVLAVVGGPWWAGIVFGAVVGAVVVWLASRNSAERMLERLSARPSPEGRYPHYDNLVEGLSLSTGLSEPDLYVVADRALNGAAITYGDTSALVVTSGLLEQCDRMELEAVLAALLSRLKSGDAEAATLIAALFGRTVLDSGAGSMFRPLVDKAGQLSFDPDREITNDQEAVSVTRYPPGLSSALERIMRGPSVPANTTVGTELLWFAPPSTAPVVPHSPLPWRLDVLSET